MKTRRFKFQMLPLVMIMFCVIFSGECLATDVPGQNITVNTVWDVAHSPYNLTGTVSVRSGATLTIQSGVQVQGSDLYVNDNGSGGTLLATGVSFSNHVVLNSGAVVTLSGNHFLSGAVWAAPAMVTSLVGNNFPPNSTVTVYGGTLTGSATIPSITNVSTYNLQNDLSIGNGGSLTIASGNTISGSDLFVNSGGTLLATGVSFSNHVVLNSGAVVTTLSGNHFLSGAVWAAPAMVTSLVGNNFPPNSTVTVYGGTLTGSATIPSITNVSTYNLQNDLSIGNGGSLTIASGNTISGSDLFVNSGGTLLATGVTFSDQLILGSGSNGRLEFDTFTTSGWNYFDGHMLVTVINNNFAGSRVHAQGTGGPINLAGNYWGTTDLAAIAQNKIYDHTDSANQPVIDFASPLATAPVWQPVATFTITASAGANGSISPNGSIIKNAGDSQMFTATPVANYTVNQWLVDGAVVQTGSTSYTLPNIQAIHSVTVSFKANTAPVTPPAISNVSPPAYPASNANQTMTINGSSFQNGATLTFVNPQGGNIPSTASKLTFVSARQITYQFNNASNAGTWNVRVNNPDGQSSDSKPFTVTMAITAAIDHELLDLIDQYAPTYYRSTWNMNIDQFKAFIATIAWGEGHDGGYTAHSQGTVLNATTNDHFMHSNSDEIHNTTGEYFAFSTGIGPFQLDRGGHDGWDTWPTIRKLDRAQAVQSAMNQWSNQFPNAGTTLEDFVGGSAWDAVITDAKASAAWSTVTGITSWSQYSGGNVSLDWSTIKATLAANVSDANLYSYDQNFQYVGMKTWNIGASAGLLTDSGTSIIFTGLHDTWLITARGFYGTKLFQYYYTYDSTSKTEVWVLDNATASQKALCYIFTRDYSKSPPPGGLPVAQYPEHRTSPGDTLSSAALNVGTDNTLPTVSITSPSSWTTYKIAQTVTINATASDNVGLSRVELYDGTTMKGSIVYPPYSYSWAITSSANGSHDWTARAYYAYGRISTSAVVTVTVNIPVSSTVAKPTITPNGGTFTSSVKVTLSSTSGATIRYTTTGVPPTSSSTAYKNTAITLTSSCTLIAKAFKGSAASDVATAVFTIVPPPALNITTHSLPVGKKNTSYSAPLATATGGTPKYTWSWTAQSGSKLPLTAKLKLTPSADSTSVTISGTPTTIGTFNFTVTVTDAKKQTKKSQPLTLTIGN